MNRTRTTVAIVALASVTGALWPTPAEAQRRAVPRAGGRSAVVVRAYYRPVYHGPLVYGGYYRPFYYGSVFYDPWYGYPFAPYSYGQFYTREAALRLQVSPKHTEVFVDGFFAGTVDEFDGIFQRLRLEAGDHEIQLYLDGYRTRTERVLLQPGRTLSIRHTMEPLGPGESPEPRPMAEPGATRYEPPRGRGERVPADPQDQAPLREADASYGTIAIRVQPADAEVLIDGERWVGPSLDEALLVQVSPGRHRIEIEKDGYQSFASDIDVHAGQTSPINVSLPRR